MLSFVAIVGNIILESLMVVFTHLIQDLGGISTAMDRYKVSLQEMMKNTEVAVRSFAILRSRFPRMVGSASTSNVGAPNAIIPATAAGAGGPATSTVPVDFYSGVPIKPSPFLVHTVTRFEHQLQEFKQWLEELERLVFADSDENGKGNTQSLLQSLPTVIKNIHDFFIYVAAKVYTFSINNCFTVSSSLPLLIGSMSNTQMSGIRITIRFLSGQ